MEMDSVFWFRLANIGLASFVISLCILKLMWNDPDHSRRMRILGIAILTISQTWLMYDRRFEPFHVRMPITTLGLCFVAYGLKLMSTDEQKTSKEQKRKSPEGR